MSKFSVSFRVGGTLTDPEKAARFVRAIRNSGLFHEQTRRTFEDAHHVVEHLWRMRTSEPTSLELVGDDLTFHQIERFAAACREAGLPYRQYVGLPDHSIETTAWNGRSDCDAVPLPEITTNGGSATVGVPLYLLTRAVTEGPEALSRLLETYRTTHDRFVQFDIPATLLTTLGEDESLDWQHHFDEEEDEPEIEVPVRSPSRTMAP